jgi:PiT family inorganic phosphate transporter
MHALIWAAFFNFVSAFTFGTKVAGTVGKGFVAGAIVWGLLTWWLGLPTSSSHAIIGGYAGAAVSRGLFEHGWTGAIHALIPGKWLLTLSFIIVAPLIGLVAAFVMLILIYWLFRKSTPLNMDTWFRKLQLRSLGAGALSIPWERV